MDFLISGITSITPQQIVMYVIGAVLIWLAINKDLEPVLLLPLGFGAILVNLPASGVLNQTLAGIGETNGIIEWLFNVGIEASEERFQSNTDGCTDRFPVCRLWW